MDVEGVVGQKVCEDESAAGVGVAGAPRGAKTGLVPEGLQILKLYGFPNSENEGKRK